MTVTYTSAEMQNELISIAAKLIRIFVVEGIKAVFISDMVDESKDVSRKEKMSLYHFDKF